jgi:hypothetical protein
VNVPELWIYNGVVVAIVRRETHRRFVEIAHMHGSHVEIVAMEDLVNEGELLMRGEEDGSATRKR